MAVTPPLVVRPREAEDVEPVCDLARGLPEWFDADGQARIASDVRTQRGFVAVQGGRLAGFILWRPLGPEAADLSWMAVAKDLQHRGIGTAFLAAFVADLWSLGYRSLEVSTVADNVDYEPFARTRRFYRARGFVDARVDPLYWGSGGDRYDRLVLRRDLSFP